jgi:ribonuclease P/MRP protein subunit POP5
LAFEIVSNSQIKDYKAVSNEITAKSLELIGTLGVAKAGLQVIKDCWKPETQKGIIRVNHKHVDEIKSALTLIQKINNKQVAVKSIGVSGILKKAKEKYI